MAERDWVEAADDPAGLMRSCSSLSPGSRRGVFFALFHFYAVSAVSLDM